MDQSWNGFSCRTFLFEGQEAKLVFPEPGTAVGGLAIKTEYWDAFPEAAELELLKNGFHLCFVQNTNRWGTEDNLDRQARLIRSLAAEYHLSSRCVAVGMSCGGLIAVKLAARYPELFSCLYLDAPVINYMSCPCGFGVGNPLNEDLTEILTALRLPSVSELLACRDMPLDCLPRLTAAGIPVVMVAGDSDRTVPFCENGVFLQQAFRKAGVPIEVYIKPGCDHHPHGLADPSPVIRFLLHWFRLKNEEAGK